jgi:hypothetical protein
MPSLQRLYKSAAGQPFVVLAVSIGEDPDTVRDFLTKLDPTPTFPVVLDTRNTAMRAWKVSGLPYTVVVDREGRVCKLNCVTAFWQTGGEPPKEQTQ